ncbi:ankyrin 2,3/unc44 [Cordyceps fumosorosea ARSEF 2679]|uniref:Ankyrin 2,3/unc44 n=1 Tax=Cordyceps fumosorosea (strain ARSEF 2679) TaxID=1081104 RepID=A0A168EU73_CORFA|nr:ankyrin 2,3/unc44 [Cordyceps fumosorosea ARSEF 2679]OAA74231.1 ankyrin 2,3/unc44 [Cordyceps fumosorosea ARSEF 2679]
MDPLSAIGLASAIVQFVQFGFQIADRLQDLTAKHPGQIPKALQSISMHLPLLANSLSKIKSDARVAGFDLDTKCILKGIVAGCLTQVQEVEAMLEEIACAPGDSLKTKLKKVVTSVRHQERLARIERTLNTYISVLILHHVVDSADAPKDLQDETCFDVREKLADAYVERKGLIEQLDAHLYDASRSQVTSPTVLLLSGAKGAGKTQLALGYCRAAHELRQFRSVFWLDASTLENLHLGFERVFATVHQSTQGSRADKMASARRFLEELWHPWLLVLDNYASAPLYNDIMDLLPSRGCGAILLLSSEDTENGLGQVLQVPKYLRPHEQERVDSSLRSAVQNKDFPAIREAVEQGADVDAKIWDEWPCIHRLALFGMDEALRYLVDHGADLQVDVQVASALHWAATDGGEATTRLLLDYEDKQMAFYSQATHQAAFNAAVENGHTEVARMLLGRRKVSVHVPNKYQQTALESAADKGNVDLVRFLISQGALGDSKSPGENALTKAASRGHLETVRVLCLEGNVNVNARRESGDTALILAADSDYNDTTLELAAFLLEQGASPDPVGYQDGLLHRAALRGKLDFVKLLLQHNADPALDGAGYCPLQYALKYDNPEVVDLLLSVEMPDAARRKAWLDAALLYAARVGKRGAVLQLLDQGADINAQLQDGSNPAGATSLLLATLEGHAQTAQFLVRRGARQDVLDARGRLPLPAAVTGGHHLLVRDLIRAGGDANLMSGEDADTPLMLAVKAKHDKVVEVLLKCGADRELANKFGEIALDIAEEKDYKEIIKLLD